MEHLIDISSHNTIYDWGAVTRDGIGAASIKATQSTNYTNPLGASQTVGATYAGIPAGAYHFGDHRIPARDQAIFFKTMATRFGALEPGQLAPMYDAENWAEGGMIWPDPRTLNAHIKEHIRTVRELTGVKEHLVYGSLSWWASGILDPDEWADGDVYLWIAVFNGRPGDLQGYNHPQAAIHQHTSTGTVVGITGYVDKNVTINDYSIADLTIGGTDMPLTDADADLVVNRLLNRVVESPQFGGGSPSRATLETVWSLSDFRTQSTNANTAAIQEGVDALLARPIADLDEAELARQLEARGIDGASPAEVKEAVLGALRSTRVTVTAGDPSPESRSETKSVTKK